MQPVRLLEMALRSWGPLTAALVWGLASYIYLVRGAGLGIELSDSSFYLLNNRYGSEISIELRQFGVIWQALFGIDNIAVGRIVNISLHFFVTFLTSFWVLDAVSRGAAAKPDPSFNATLALIVTPTSAIFFEAHLLDFSYNSASYIFFALIVASVLQLSRCGASASTPLSARWQLAFAVLLGFAFFGMGLVKPQTALLAAFTLLSLFLLLERRAWTLKDLARLAIGFLIGCLLFVALLTRVVSPISLAQNMIDGYLGLKLLGAQKATLGAETYKLLRFVDKLASAPLILLGKAPQIALPSFLLLAATVFHPHLVRWLGKWRLNGTLLGLLVLLLLGLVGLDSNQAPRIFAFAFVCLLVLATTFLFATPRAQRTRGLFWLLPTGLGFAFLLFLSTNDWYGAHHRSIALSLMAAAALLPLIHRERRFAGLIALLAVVALYSLPPIKRHEARLYRLGAPLGQARVVVDFGKELGQIKLPPRAALAYLSLSELQQDLARLPQDQRPSLIDMTGRAPGFALYLGLRPPATTWIASGYPGSDAFLAYTLDKMSDDTMRRAYIVVADAAMPDASISDASMSGAENAGANVKHLSASVLNQRLAVLGQRFPGDYEAVGKSENPYKQQAVTIYRPRR